MATPKLIVIKHDSIPALRLAIKNTSDAGTKTRIKAVLKALEGRKRKNIAAELIISERSVGIWIGKYNKHGLLGLQTKASGRKPGPQKWDSSLFEELSKEIDKGGYWSIPRMQEWIENKYKKNIPEQTVWYRMDQLNYSYKGARPHPMQGNKERQESFKKRASFRSWSR